MANTVRLTDDSVPELEILLGDNAAELLTAALAEADGTPKAVRISQVRYVPGKSVTVQYRCDVVWADGSTTREIYVASAGIAVPDDVLVIGDDATQIALWRYPNDPFLPGLAAGADPEKVRQLLSQLGVTTDVVRLRTRAYRPGRRAVIEAKATNARVFLKIVRPARVGKLQAIHASMTDSVQIPQSLGWSEESGLVVLQAMPGKTLRKAIESRTKKLPTGGQLSAMLDQIPAGFNNEVLSARSRAADHARLLAAVVPDQNARIQSLVDALPPSSGEVVPVHGDFHASQLLVRGPMVLGMIDVDTVGEGQRSHDYGNFLGHLATLGLISPARQNMRRYGAELLTEFDLQVDPAELRLDIAATILGLATGPFRVFEKNWEAQTTRRLELAEQWVQSAESL